MLGSAVFRPVATNNPGPFAFGSGGERHDADLLEPALGQHSRRHGRPRTRARRGPSAGGSSRGRAAACRRRAPGRPGLSTRATSASALRGFGHVVQHQHQRRRVEPRVVDRQRFELAPAQIDVVEAAAAACVAAWSIAADASTAMTRATNGASAALTWPVPQPRSPTIQLGVGERRRARRDETDRRTARRAADPTGRPTRRRTPATWCGVRRALPAAGADPAPRPASARPARAPAARAARRAGSSSSRVIVYRLLVPSDRAATQPASASALRCRLTVDCGSCMMPHSSDTVSSCRSSSSSMRLRVVSASDAR